MPFFWLQHQIQGGSIIFWNNSLLKQMMFRIFHHHQLQGNTTQQYYEAEKSSLKGIVHSKVKILSWFTHVLNLYDFICPCRIFKPCMLSIYGEKKSCLLFKISTEEIKSYSSE